MTDGLLHIGLGEATTKSGMRENEEEAKLPLSMWKG